MKNSKPQLKVQNFFILAILFFLPVYLVKIKYGWASFNVLELLIAILFVSWIFNKNTKYQIPNTKYWVSIALIFVGLISSVIANKNFYTGFGAIKGWFIFPIIFSIILYDALKYDGILLKKSLLALFFSGVAVSVVGVVYKFLGILTFDGRLKILWDSPNQLAMFLAVPFLIGLFFSLRERNVNKKRLYVLSLVLTGLILYYTLSYGAWLAIAVALIVIFWLKYRKKEQKKYLVIFAMILLVALAWASVYKYKSIANLGERSSLASREMIWKSAGLMIENNPIFGIGPGNFQEKYLEYQKYFPPYLEWSVPQPHNIFLAFWLESGLVGLISFLILLFYFFRDNKKAIQANHEISILLLGIMIYILVHGLIDTTYWRNDLAVVFWAVVAANIYLEKKQG
ncbi:MAG: O-antigen ligase family protein [Candidatus Moranbacteria bacterium]|nr:O-antigen ligase family protein [Candidatus Moranbacteria bacterium]